ncbi:hypothetical protein WJX72_012313 [[Myrmecia] bisecta]|uniref:2-phosphoglycerate kinase n=1 Tax=[Myrmecia] bisecta TaxID=41462 RepID=A0AAW1Q1D2_9CHLO
MMQRVAEQKALDKSRQNASKYDFVKVKVWLGEAMNHYYVLSRFLICRMLTVTKIPHMKAVKIALEVKKYLVDNNHLDISQDNLEAILFNIMRSRGFGDDFVRRYKLVTKFFQLRRPLIILICGASCTGKSTLAQQLASRLNLPNVLQTDIIYDLIRLSEDSPLQQTPLWERSELPPTHLVNEFQRECRIVRKGVEGDLIKAIRDGKSIIIEGLHLDPGLYLYEFGRYGLMHLMDKIAPLVQPRDVDAATEAEAEATAAAAEKDAKAAEEAAANEVEVSAKAAAEDELRDMPTIPAPLFPRMPMRAASFNDVTFMLQKDGTLGRRIPMRSLSSSQGLGSRISAAQLLSPGPGTAAGAIKLRALTVKKAAMPLRPPVLVRNSTTAQLELQIRQMTVATEWYARHKAHAGEADAGDFQAQCDAALERLRVLQDHLCAYAQRSVPVVTFDIASFGETLDRLHDYLLQCIEMAMEQ